MNTNREANSLGSSQNQPPIKWPETAKEKAATRQYLANQKVDPQSDPWVKSLMADDHMEILRIANMEMLIDSILPVEALGFLFGESGSGKSFVMLDAACSISTGEPWFGLATPPEGALVIYVAAEGSNGLRIRKRGWEQERNVSAENMRILSEAVMMDDEKQVSRLIECIKKVCLLSDNNVPVLIVLDTFARSMLGEENSNTDAAAFVRGCEALRIEFGCAVVSVHHSGHKDKGRMRGASAIHAAADCVIKLEPKSRGTVELTCSKSKDIEPFNPIELKLVKSTLNGITRADGEPISTLVVSETCASDRSEVTSFQTKDERLIIQLLGELSKPTKSDLRTAFTNAHMNKNLESAQRQYRRALASLKKKRLVEINESENICLLTEPLH